MAKYTPGDDKAYKDEAAFQAYKDTLEKEPEGDNVRKEFWVGCSCKEDWDYIHEVLMEEGSSEDHIPSESIECCDHCRHSDVRGVFMLTNLEVAEIKKHSKVEYININGVAKYPGTYLDNPDDITYASHFDPPSYRYADVRLHQKWLTDATMPHTSPTAAMQGKGGPNIKRHMHEACPWLDPSNPGAGQVVLSDRCNQYGTGEGVDVIVCDQDAWYGHIEFQNNVPAADSPSNYIGGNVLPGSGTCDVLDLCLEAPYYLDPDFFDDDPGSRLDTRWDGTIVPKESFARNWWSNDSLTYRSSKFVSVGNGGTATGYDDFGTIAISSSYNRATSNGSNTAYKTGSGYHATPCMSQAYGRTYGWAYNSNKWHLNLFGTGGVFWEKGFDLQKVFHQIKPVNPTYGTQDPTISSNSWGMRTTSSSAGFYYFRVGTTGSGGIYYNGTRPKFMNGYYGTSSLRGVEYIPGHSALTAGAELLDSGALFIYATGNHRQKQVSSTHPDYDNYHGTNSGQALGATGTTQSGWSSMGYHHVYNTHNRTGYPGQIGSFMTPANGTPPERVYRAIGIGALDEGYYANKERIVAYSNRGEQVDAYTSAEDTPAASDNRTGSSYRYDRYDATYTGGTIDSEDRQFGGTSSATPIAVGILATKLQYNRGWTYEDVRTFLRTTINELSATDFEQGTEATTASDFAWNDSESLQGGERRVLWDELTGNEPSTGGAGAPVTAAVSGSGLQGGTITTTLSCTDTGNTDPATITFSIVVDPAYKTTIPVSIGAVSYSAPNFLAVATYTHDGSAQASDSFTYKANDGSSDSNTSMATITITVVNPPVVEDVSGGGNEGGTISVILRATDVDSSDPATFSFTIISNPTYMTGVVSIGTVSYEPAMNLFSAMATYTHDGSSGNTSDSFTYKANDGSYDSNTATATLTITGVDDPPVANDVSGSGDQGGTILTLLTATDPDNTNPATFSFTVVSQPSYISGIMNIGAVTYVGGVFQAYCTYKHDGTANFSDSYTYKATSQGVDSNTATTTISITELADDPFIPGGSASATKFGKSKKGDARKVVGITPKFYIKDEGTDYTTGEEYNGLWSAGTITSPTGYADCGIWKFLERQGTVAFNHRTHSKNPISLSNIVWSKDLTADSISFKLIDHEPYPGTSEKIYAMLGSGGAYAETKATNWISYLQSPGLEDTYPSTGGWGVSFTIDMWVYCRKAPQSSNLRQTLFHAVNKGGNTGTTNPYSHDSLLPGTCIQWDISNRAGTLAMNFTWPINTAGETGGAGQQTIWSSSAAKALWPNFATDPTADGGLHHIAVVF